MSTILRKFPDMAGKYVDDGRIQLLEHIGHGGWGLVCRGKDFSGGREELVAVKVILKPSRTSKRAGFLRREIEFHRRMSDHPHVVTLRRVFSDACFVYIVLDYLPEGDMWRAIQDRAVFARNEGLVKHAFLQIVDVVEACHAKGIYHRDIKPNNILINHDCTKIYLTDFGLSTDTRDSAKFGTGTGPYKSPECCNFGGEHKTYSTERNDMWALGVTLLNMITGLHPWPEASSEDNGYKAWLRNPQYLRTFFPISKQADFVLRRIFTPYEADSVSFDMLRQLICAVETFNPPDSEVAQLRPGMHKWAKRPYLYEDSEDCSEESGAERFDSSSTNSLADDSDDSDEHSNGVRSRSLLAVEEGLRGVAVGLTDSVITAAGVDNLAPRQTTPITPPGILITTPKQQNQTLAAMPAKSPSSSHSPRTSAGTSSSNRSASSQGHNLAKQENRTTRRRDMLMSGLRDKVKRIFRPRNTRA